jgi:hypothetical protein
MKTAISAPVIWLVLAALADPGAAQVEIPSRSPVGEVIARSGGAPGEDAHSEAPRG